MFTPLLDTLSENARWVWVPDVAGANAYTVTFTNNLATTGSITVASLTSSIPEPSTYAVIAGIAVIGVATLRRRLAHAA
jgi:hypothetical protein